MKSSDMMATMAGKKKGKPMPPMKKGMKPKGGKKK
jgi:hypothetical protein